MPPEDLRARRQPRRDEHEADEVGTWENTAMTEDFPSLTELLAEEHELRFSSFTNDDA